MKPYAYAFGIVLAVVFLAGCGRHYYDHDHYRYGGRERFGSAQEAYKIGYREGYHHGTEDARLRLNFDYRHDHRFRSGISYDTYVNEAFRKGYARGYKDGYYLRR